MKKHIFNSFFIVVFAFTAVSCKNENKNEVEPTPAEVAAEAGEEAVRFVIDTTASTINWKGSKPTGEHIGTIQIKEGFFTANAEEIESGTVVIDMTSVEVLDEDLPEERKTMLEQHLMGTVEGKETDFFNVEKFPEAVFEVTGFREVAGETILSGNLTLKEETKNIEFQVDLEVNGETLTLKSEPFIIDRTLWGVNYGSKSVFSDLGDNWISDEMQLQFEVKAEKAE